ncbi:MAG: radical SAM protein [Candidatus Cloacimonadales bacterium]|nr:radical SAM protein [Candidatus Cloacimonadales bacterium]
MKIILIRPRYKSHLITPPLGLGYLSSYLQKHGIETIIIDALRDNISNDEVLSKIMVGKPDAVGITCLTAFYNEVVDLSLKFKKQNIKIIIGGVHPTFLPQQTLQESECDFVILGEGEKALLKLLQNGLDNAEIPGVYSLADFSQDDLEIVKAERIENLDELPFPDWEQIDPNSYPPAPHGALIKHYPVAPITTTRGCPYSCTFCASPGFYNRQIRFRSPENVIEEIKFLIKNFGVKEIHFEDDNLTLKRDHIEKICQLMIKNNIKISWACPNGIRADAVYESLIKLMKKSGCYLIAFGVESADPQILENIGKHESIETIENSINMAYRARLSCQGFFIFGLPGETKETLEKTINFAKKSKLDRAQFIILDVLPGSKLWNDLQGKFEPNWHKNSYKEPEWIPEGVTKKMLLQSQAKAFREFYFTSPLRFLKLTLLIRPKQIKYLLQRLFDYRIVKHSG